MLGSLVKLLLTLYAALVVFILGVLLPIALMFRVPLRAFLKAVAEPVTIAFGTASSEAALPRAMEAMEAIGVPRQIVAFVIPDRLQLQPHRQLAVSFGRGDLCRAGFRHSSLAGPAAA